MSKCSNLKIQYAYLKKQKYRINLKKIIYITKLKKPNVLIIHDYNLLPFFLYSIFMRTKLIYVHHTPDKTKNIIDWISYFFNSILADKIVLVSKRKKNDFIFKINNIFFSRKINVIENGINIKKFKK